MGITVQVRSSEIEGGTVENRYVSAQFLSAGLALPVAGLASTTSSHTPPAPLPLRAAPKPGKITYRVLGNTRLEGLHRRLRLHDHLGPDGDHKSVEMGINYFDTCRSYQNGQNERMLGAALGARRKDS